MKGKYVWNTMTRKDYKEGITLVITISKPTILPFFFAGLREMDLPREDMHLLIYDNTNDPAILEGIKNEMDNFQCQKCRKFKSVRIYKSFLRPRATLYGTGNPDFSKSTLHNIWHMWQRLYKMVYTDTFFQIEDDTIAPPDAFKRLYALLMKDPKVGFVTGIETGRNAIPYMPTRLGIHSMRMRKGKLLERKSFSPNTKGVVEIDAAGVYCFAARLKAYKTGFINYKPVANIFSMFAMDNVLTYNMKKHGWKLLADFGCWCAHLQISTGSICLFGKDQALHFTDLYIPKYDCYAIGLQVKEDNKKIKLKIAECFDLHPDRAQVDEEKIEKSIKEAIKEERINRRKKKKRSTLKD